MCGIFAACQFQKPVSIDQASRAIRRLHHRGPDGTGVWKNATSNVTLAHARLSLVGVANGTQPIASEDNQIHAVVNGEFYGYRQIRSMLETQGHCFRTDSDSEILIHLYEQYGQGCLDHLRGEFAFVLWDQRRQQLLAARDRFGVKPLLYTITQDGILVASEAKAILPEIDSGWDHESMFMATALQYLPPGRTLFAGIHQLPPGHTLTFDATGLHTERYWDFNFPRSDIRCDIDQDNDVKELPAVIERLRDTMREVVRLRLHGDVPVCFHLSGGLDSSSILGIATHLTQTPHHAFTLEFEESGYDESQQARDTADFCNAVWHPVRVTRQNILDAMSDAVIGSEGLAINGHLSAKYLLNRAIHHSGFRAVLSGEAADELFAGYAHLRLDHWRPANGHDQTQDLSRTNASQMGMMLPSGDGLSLSAADRRLGYQPVFLQAKATLGKRLRSLMNPDWLSHRADRDPCENLLKECSVADQLSGRSALRQSTWLWSKLALAGYIFRTLGDGTEMPWSVEGRVPFADHVLFESIRDLRTDWLIRNGVEKHVLREAMRPYVTDAVYARQKHPLDAPPVLTGDQNVIRSVRERIESAEFARQPFFCQHRVAELMDRTPRLTPDERKLWDPALMMILSTIAIQQLIDSAAGRSF